ncbi:diaminopimelate dehydrogenase [Vagococcus elongatus]|uniref:Meso-diaminopimelate D-dehydrogenase n=1 Tax=Vagococcus elongatus TaxID=180344 RepID=A0A430AUY5_9ENTE|nr:diaminopimelate dehydrogenase [Vagococcus elongatus]RSU11861.1 diaminopimelate dehydrogenase [Vagococcus elongatus]
MIRVAIVGYGNLGRGVEKAIKKNSDMSLIGIFTRRKPETVSSEGSPVFPMAELMNKKEDIDVCILCGGSATDLPEQTPKLTQWFNTVDSFDTHAKIPEHFLAVDKIAKEHQKTSIISVGWDPGLFSLNRLIAKSILPQGETLTFWGKGVSQGHSDALRRVSGVADAVQYTIPNDEIIERLKAGEKLELTARDKHVRECFVVLEEGADQEKIKNEIIEMPNYFSDYDTTVHFISQKTLESEHKQGMPHGGKVLRVGETSEGMKQVYDFSLDLQSNPEFTASVIVAYARACVRLADEKVYGAQTVFDVAPKYLTQLSDDVLRKDYL